MDNAEGPQQDQDLSAPPNSGSDQQVAIPMDFKFSLNVQARSEFTPIQSLWCPSSESRHSQLSERESESTPVWHSSYSSIAIAPKLESQKDDCDNGDDDSNTEMIEPSRIVKSQSQVDSLAMVNSGIDMEVEEQIAPDASAVVFNAHQAPTSDQEMTPETLSNTACTSKASCPGYKLLTWT